MANPDEILEFWIDEVGPEGWYMGTPALDQTIIDRFMDDYESAARGELTGWISCPTKSLALLILLDQFPRNMFRGSGKSFATDRKALCCAKKSIDKGFDMRTPEPQRQFYYLPLMHSESLMDQERCVRLMTTRMVEGGESNILHAKVHRAVIRKFGRFPYRNEALARTMTSPEIAYLASGGYAETLRELQA